MDQHPQWTQASPYTPQNELQDTHAHTGSWITAPPSKYHCTLPKYIIHPLHVTSIPHIFFTQITHFFSCRLERHHKETIHISVPWQTPTITTNTSPTQNPTTRRRSRLSLTSIEKGSTCDTRSFPTPQPYQSHDQPGTPPKSACLYLLKTSLTIDIVYCTRWLRSHHQTWYSLLTVHTLGTRNIQPDDGH